MRSLARRCLASLLLLSGCNLLLDNQVGIAEDEDADGSDSGVPPGASSSGGSSGGVNDGGEQDGADASAPVVVATRDGRALTAVSVGPNRYQLTVPWSPVDNSLIVDATIPDAVDLLGYTLGETRFEVREGGVMIDGALLTPDRPQELDIAYRDAVGEQTLVVELTTRARMPTPHVLHVPKPNNQQDVSTTLSLAFAADGARIAVGTPQIMLTNGGLYEFLRVNGSWTLDRALAGVHASRSGAAVVYADDGKLYFGAPGQQRIVQPDAPAAQWNGDVDFGDTLAAGPLGVLTINSRNVVKVDASGAKVASHNDTFTFGAPRLLATAGDMAVAGPVVRDVDGATTLLAFAANQPNPELVVLEGGQRVAAVVMNERFLVVGSPRGQVQGGMQIQIFEREGSSWVSKLKEEPLSNSVAFGRSLALCGNLLLVGAPEENFVVSYRLDRAELVDKGTYTLSAGGSFFGGAVACAPGKVAIGARREEALAPDYGWIEVYE